MSSQGIGEALVIRNKCKKLVPLTSSSKLISTDNDNLFKIIYKNSFIGSKTFSMVSNIYNFSQGSDELTNFFLEPFVDEESNIYLFIDITGIYKKCNYSLIDLQILLPSENSSASVRETLKKNSKSPEEFKKLLKEKPNINTRYLQLKSKLGK